MNTVLVGSGLFSRVIMRLLLFMHTLLQTEVEDSNSRCSKYYEEVVV